MKKRVLFVYSTMMLGGSTTSLLSLLQNFDYEKYQVDLLLYKAEGPFIVLWRKVLWKTCNVTTEERIYECGVV